MAAMAHVAGIALPGLQAVDFGRGDQVVFIFIGWITVLGRAMIPELFNL